MSMHEGHRRRLKERYCKEGLENFDELYVLELLLFYCVSRKDTNPIAHGLLDHFGSLNRVLAASREELMRVEGVGEHTAILLSMLKEVNRYCEVLRSKEDDVAQTIDACAGKLQPYLKNCKNEKVYMLCLNAKCKVLGCELVGEGSVNSANISVRKIVEIAMKTNAVSVVLAHNHPSGFAKPSAEDVQTTKRIGRALDTVDIILVDHLVFDDDDWVSMRHSNLYSYYEIKNSRE